MPTTTQGPPESTPNLAETRSAVYRFLLAALECPDQHNHAWLTSADFAHGLELLGDRFAVEVETPDGPLFPTDPDDAQSDYLACFEVGLKGPPVPLLASHYNRREPVTATIHEHVLFYRRFGASVPAASPDPPDHLRHELAFLIHLDELWGAGRIDALSAARARVDFLSRQLDRWVGRAVDEAEKLELPPVYIALLTVLRRVVDDDLAASRDAVQALEREEPTP